MSFLSPTVDASLGALTRNGYASLSFHIKNGTIMPGEVEKNMKVLDGNIRKGLKITNLQNLQNQQTKE